MALILLISGTILGGFSQLKSTYFDSINISNNNEYEFTGINDFEIEVDEEIGAVTLGSELFK